MKRSLSAVLIALMLLLLLPAGALAEEPPEDAGLRLEQGVLTVSLSGSLPALERRFRPEELESIHTVLLGPALDGLDEGALRGCSHLRSLRIPEGVVRIGDCAFEGCSALERIECDSPAFLVQDGLLLSADGTRLILCPAKLSLPRSRTGRVLSVPESVTEIAPGAFSECSQLGALMLPSGLRVIGARAFSGCLELRSLFLPPSVEQIGEGAFTFCNRLSLTMPDNPSFLLEDQVLYTADRKLLLWCGSADLGSFRVPEGVERIGEGAFACCDATSLLLPESLRSIGSGAFVDNRLSELTLPAGLEELGDGVFRANNFLAAIQVAEGNRAFVSVDGVLFSADGTELLCCPGGRHARGYRIPEGIERIWSYAFTGFRLHGCLSIPASVTEISDLAFCYCFGLSAFAVDPENPCCSAVDGVLYNKDQSVLLRYPCEKEDTRFVLPATVRGIGPYAFHLADQLQAVELPESLVCIGASAFDGCDQLREIVFSEGLFSIGDEAFYDCDIPTIRLPASVRVLGDGAFRHCESLESFAFSSCPDYLGEGLLRACYDLTEVTLPEGLTEIPPDMFSYCSELKEVALPASLTRIGAKAFEDCRSLTEISLPAGVTEIGPNAFASCSDLETLCFAGTREQWESVVLGDGALSYFVKVRCADDPAEDAG